MDVLKCAVMLLHEHHSDDRALRRRVLEMLLDAGYGPSCAAVLWIMRHGTWFASALRADDDSGLCARIVASAQACERVAAVSWLINYYYYESSEASTIYFNNDTTLRGQLMLGRARAVGDTAPGGRGERERGAFGQALARSWPASVSTSSTTTKCGHEVLKPLFDTFVRNSFGRLPIEYACHDSMHAALDIHMRARAHGARPQGARAAHEPCRWSRMIPCCARDEASHACRRSSSSPS